MCDTFEIFRNSYANRTFSNQNNSVALAFKEVAKAAWNEGYGAGYNHGTIADENARIKAVEDL